MLLKIHPDNPQPRAIAQVIDTLNKGGVIVYPTDTIYGIGCDINNQKAIEKVARIKNMHVEKADFSFIFADLSHLSEYTKNVSTPVFKILKQYLPGPYTFILEANSNVPRIFKNKKKTIGIRIPGNNIVHSIVKELGHPIITTSVHDDDEVIEYTTDPELIHERYKDMVNLVIDGGYGNNVASTVVDLSSGEPVIIRQGIGQFGV